VGLSELIRMFDCRLYLLNLIVMHLLFETPSCRALNSVKFCGYVLAHRILLLGEAIVARICAKKCNLPVD